MKNNGAWAQLRLAWSAKVWKAPVSAFLLSLPLLAIFFDTGSMSSLSLTGVGAGALLFVGVWTVRFFLDRFGQTSARWAGCVRRWYGLFSLEALLVCIYPSAGVFLVAMWCFLLRLWVEARLSRREAGSDTRSILMADLGYSSIHFDLPHSAWAILGIILALCVNLLVSHASVMGSKLTWVPFVVIATGLMSMLTSRMEAVKNPEGKCAKAGSDSGKVVRIS